MKSKVCSKCGEKKPFNGFYKRKSGRQAGRYMSQCKECNLRQNKKQGYRRHNKSRVLERKYGITIEQYELMKHLQDNKCSICDRKLVEGAHQKANAPCIDHDHDTGDIRGILCNHCNRALGLFGDDISRLKRAQQYLARTSLVEIK